MSKLLSEEQIEVLFQKHLDDKLGSGTRRTFYASNNTLEASARTAFKHVFTLLMPIIKKQQNHLNYYADPEMWMIKDKYSWRKSSPKSHGDDEMILGYEHPNRDWKGTIVVGGKRARQAIKETKQMLEGLGEVK